MTISLEPTKHRRFPVFRVLVLLLLIGAAIAGCWVWRDYQVFRDQPLNASADAVLLVERGDSFLDVLSHLREIGIDQGYALQWKALAWQLGVLTRLQVGEYAIESGITPRQLLEKIGRGQVIQHRFTIVEGWNFHELRAALAREAALTQTLASVSDEAVMAQLSAINVHPEGRFLPETYLYTRGTRDIDLLQRAYRAMQQTLDLLWAERDRDLPLNTSDEALTLASIVEKETGLAAERPRIAGVFLRRLRLGMKLQTDPTVIYGLGANFTGNLTRRHLETDTPYNTYSRGGLPPTPIAMPGRAALEATLHPEKSHALYFVARGDGSHWFSSTLDEHNRAVRQYQLRQP